MPSVTAANEMWDSWTPNMPAFTVALLDADGDELSGSGYVAATIAAGAWDDADEGIVRPSSALSFGTATGPWDSAVAFELRTVASGAWLTQALVEPVKATSAGAVSVDAAMFGLTWGETGS